ncbi:hypothetical protein GCM10022251_78520 [Phytohabitans flavus]
MFVGDVYAERLAGARSPPMLSAGSPVAGSTMATIDRQVSRAYVRRGSSDAEAGAAGRSRTAAEAAARRRRMETLT